MKKLIFIFLLLFVSSSVWAAEEFSFRGVKWDMNQNDIKVVEKGVLKGELNQALIYDIEDFYQMSATVYYYFKNNNLSEVIFVVNESEDEEANLSFLQAKYTEIKKDIQDEYGKITYDNYEEDFSQQSTKPRLYLTTIFKGKSSYKNKFTISLFLNKTLDKPYRLSLSLQVY